MNFHNKIIKNKKAFTLVEVIVTVVILGILTAIAVPTYHGVTESSNKKIFETNHNIIVSGINMYISAHNGAYPPTINALIDGKYIMLDDYSDFESDDITTYVFFEDEPKDATYTLVTAKNGFELTSVYKDNSKVFSRGSLSSESTVG